MVKVLFYRDFLAFTGGHLKVWHYYNHVLHTTTCEPHIIFSKRSLWNETNPWYRAGSASPPTEFMGRPDVLFLGGHDWTGVEAIFREDPGIPVINLIQGMSHANPEDAKFAFLNRRAVRICVSKDVEDRILSTGTVNGPVFVIPNSVEIGELPEPLPDRERDIDLLFLAYKNKPLGSEITAAFRRPGLRVDVLQKRTTRQEFLQLVRRARIAVFLPKHTEGFFMPALEAMALETLVVCPDCVGNRGWCLDGVNCFRPDYSFEDLCRATETALSLEPGERREMVNRALETVSEHSVRRERQMFLDLLARIGEVWSG